MIIKWSDRIATHETPFLPGETNLREQLFIFIHIKNETARLLNGSISIGVGKRDVVIDSVEYRMLQLHDFQRGFVRDFGFYEEFVGFIKSLVDFQVLDGFYIRCKTLEDSDLIRYLNSEGWNQHVDSIHSDGYFLLHEKPGMRSQVITEKTTKCKTSQEQSISA